MNDYQPKERESVIPLRLTLVPGGSSITLTHADMLVGRHSEADVRLNLPDVSRRHCRFRFHDGNWHIHDLQSMNGVYVNNERVGQAALRDADRIRIGSYTFEVRLGEQVSVSAHPNTLQTVESGTGKVLAIERPHRQAS